MDVPNSPIFPASQLTLSPAALTPVVGIDQELDTWIPQLPEKPLAQTSSIQVYLIPTEKTLYMSGFDSEAHSDKPPTLLRGCLYIRVLKSMKIKSISLVFKGQQKTNWPEGIPPKKTTYTEVNDLITHTWPFYQITNPVQTQHCGADFFRELPRGHSDSDVTSFALDNVSTHTSTEIENGRKILSGLIRKATSPGGPGDGSFTDLTAMLSIPDNDSSKPGHFSVGDYIYNFEQPLHQSLAETTNVTFGTVHYSLEATIVRQGTFKSNLVAKLPIEIVRVPSEENLEENEPIIINRDWDDQLTYDIVIGRKSIVLDSYLPLAVRFVPLFGKVSLHRIRVYLTENLEYYCHNQKVHRMEPPKKFLLLEHKAEKKKSLLTEYKDSGEEEVIPRELEFQLYVPSVLDEKFHHRIHPDTSFQNIQSHHWIKICLRLSRLDPENPEKRKHYEISIDSPIHVLSEKAAHANTLLPAYDITLESTQNHLPQYDPVSPPNSPGVIPIDGTLPQNQQNFMLGVSHANNSSLDAMMHQIEPEFYHLNVHSDEPAEVEPELHLEANLYKPDEEHSDIRMKSPQALPHPSTFSSPSLRPIHYLRKPSINPPTFEASTLACDVEGIPPPAYEEESGLSMSPLRIDESRNSSGSRSSRGRGNVSLPLSVDSPVKNLLLDQLSSKKHSHNTPGRVHEEEDIANLSDKVRVPDFSIPSHSLSPVRVAPKPHANSNSSSTLETDQESSLLSSVRSRANTCESSHAGELSQVPENTGKTISESNDDDLTQTEKTISPAPLVKDDKEEDYSAETGVTDRTSGTLQKTSPNLDSLDHFADAGLSILDSQGISNHLATEIDMDETGSSRRGSVISEDLLLEQAPEQAYPLLINSMSSITKENTLSRTSLNSLQPEKRINGSSFVDITDMIGMNTGIHYLSDNLSNFRNPRIKKHYQDINSDSKHNTFDSTSFTRQKSFGVVDQFENTFNMTKMNEEQNLRGGESSNQKESSIIVSSNDRIDIPGFKMDYDIK